jgi:hypothetical protein
MPKTIVHTDMIGDNVLKNHTGLREIMDPIDDIVNLVNADGGSDEGTGEIVGGIATTGSDRIEEILTMLRSIAMTMGSMDKRMSALEASVASMNRRMTQNKPRTLAALPNPDALKITESPVFKSPSSASGVSTPRNHEPSGSAPSIMNTPTEMLGTSHFHQNVTGSSIPFGFPSRGVVKSHSAIADRGYTTKASLWGTCLASLLVACMRRYILKTGESMHVIDENILMSTYREIVGDLYRKIKFTDLPAVSSPSASFMATTFSRPDKNTLTTSTASDWLEISKHADGVEAMAVIESMVLAAKMVPEAMIHPISKMVEQIKIPIVMENSKGQAVFSIPKGTEIPTTPGPYENCCRIFKAKALRTYVTNRLAGADESTALSTMIKTMRESEMFDQSNMGRGAEVISALGLSP